MKIFKIYFVTLLFLSFFTATSCGDDEVVIPNGGEIITTLNYTLTPEAGGTPVVMSFQDLDGDGGNAPTLTSGTLAAGTTYMGAIELLNETTSPVEDITEEIKAEEADHQFFFASTLSGLTVTYSDMDANGHPIGLSTTLTTEDTGSGTLTLTLRHLPNKTAIGVAGGDLTNAGGETDIEIIFNVMVE